MNFLVMGPVWERLLLMAHRHMLRPHDADVNTWVWKTQRTLHAQRNHVKGPTQCDKKNKGADESCK